MIKRITLLFAAVIVASAQLIAQDTPFDKSKFTDKAGFEEANKKFKEGLKSYSADKPDYAKALKAFTEAQKFNPNNSELNYKLGVCLLKSPDKFSAESYLVKALELNPELEYKIHYYLGQSYQLNTAFNLARLEFEKFEKSKLKNKKQKTSKEAEKEKAEFDVKKRIKECMIGDSLVANPVKVRVQNLGPNVNSQYPDYTPHITADESQIFFTSRRDDTQGKGKDDRDQKYYEDIYVSEKTDTTWGPAKNMGKTVNSSSHDAAAGLSPDGHNLFVFKGDEGGGDIYMSSIAKKGWSEPKSVGKTINTKENHETSACLSPDGTTLYFISNKEGGRGGHDIWFAKYVEATKAWGEPRNLSNVNSKYDEEGVFMHPDGKTLFFSSRGDGSMGGYDIFCSKFENNKWQKPVNMGYPINSPDDDVFFEVSASGRNMYFASVKKEGYGEKDIYVASYIEDKKTPKMKVALLKGLVRDAETKQPIEAKIELVDLTKDEKIGTFSSDGNSGKYLVSLPSGRNYGAVVQAPGYLFASDNFNLPDTADYIEYNKIFDLVPVKVGSAVTLNNIFFETGKWDLKKESTNELDRLLGFIKTNTKMKIEIAGHTDNVGKDDYNQQLSEKRSESVVKYLTGKGIPTEQLQFHGYGEKKPVATNDSPEGRQTNRRIEFEILAN